MVDLNVVQVHSAYIEGQGVNIAIVDDGLESEHEDIQENYVDGIDFVDGDSDPTREAGDGGHGTSVAGIAAARGWNGIGSRGVAPWAGLLGFNLLENYTPLNELESLGESDVSSKSDIFNMSYGIDVSYIVPLDPIMELQFDEWGKTGRDGKGNIYVKSAGNGFEVFYEDGDIDKPITCSVANQNGLSCQNTAMDPQAMIPQIINVAAVNSYSLDDRWTTSYSTHGSANWISAPGGEFGYDINLYGDESAARPAILTTDQSGCDRGYSRYGNEANGFDDPVNANPLNENCNYTSTFNGTSAAAPMISGVVALMLEANTELSWRDVKYLLAKTARKLSDEQPIQYGGVTQDSGWTVNAAGFQFHNGYGFGIADAHEAVKAAQSYQASLGSEIQLSVIEIERALKDIPNGSNSGLVTPVDVTSPGKVESVRVVLELEHDHPKDLSVALISPSGTKSVLLSMDSGYLDISFDRLRLSTNAFYQEEMEGEWLVEIYDLDGDESNAEFNIFPNQDYVGQVGNVSLEVFYGSE